MRLIISREAPTRAAISLWVSAHPEAQCSHTVGVEMKSNGRDRKR